MYFSYSEVLEILLRFFVKEFLQGKKLTQEESHYSEGFTMKVAFLPIALKTFPHSVKGMIKQQTGRCYFIST